MMGAAGSKWIKHSKANSQGLRTRRWGAPPHPVRVLAGMRFSARGRGAGAQSTFPFVVARVNRAEGVAFVRSENPAAQGAPALSLRCESLLATRPLMAADLYRQGRAYQFLSFQSRPQDTAAKGPGGSRPRPAGYDGTPVLVVAVDDRGVAELRLPEWHPLRPVVLPARLLPAGFADAGAVLMGRANLGCGTGFGADERFESFSGGGIAGSLSHLRAADAEACRVAEQLMVPAAGAHPVELHRGDVFAPKPFLARAIGGAELTVLDDPDAFGRVVVARGDRRFQICCDELLAVDELGFGLSWSFVRCGQ